MCILSKGHLKQKQSESWKYSYLNPLFLVNFCWYPLLKQYDIFGEQTFDTEPTDKMKYLTLIEHLALATSHIYNL